MNYYPVTPIKFVIYKNIVWFTGLYVAPGIRLYSVFAYGNPGNINPFVGAFNNEPVTFETPWLDANKPGTIKMSRGIDAVLEGNWTLYGASDYLQDPNVNPTGTGIQWKQLVSTNVPTPQGMFYGFPGQGTHFKFRGVCIDGTSRATLSSLIWHYNEANEKH
jgi:hypothetical protein